MVVTHRKGRFFYARLSVYLKLLPSRKVLSEMCVELLELTPRYDSIANDLRKRLQRNSNQLVLPVMELSESLSVLGVEATPDGRSRNRFGEREPTIVDSVWC